MIAAGKSAGGAGIDSPEFWALANAWASSTIDTPQRAASMIEFIKASCSHSMPAALTPAMRDAVYPKWTLMPDSMYSDLLAAMPAGVERSPSGYAYRYPDGLIRFSNAEEINGSRPSESIPFYFDTPPPVAAAHPDDVAVDRFAVAMKAKMAAARAKGRSGWDNGAICSADRLRAILAEHIVKGDPIDVGNFAMMLHHHGARASCGTTSPEPASQHGTKEPR